MAVDIAALQQRRSEIQAAVKLLADLEASGQTLSAEQQEDFTKLSAEFEEIQAKIARAETAERMAAATATPISGNPAQPRAPPLQTGESIGLIARAWMVGNGDPRAAARYAESEGHPEIAAALSVSTGTGGFIVPPSYSTELVELLRPASVVRRMGPRVVPMANGSFSQPRQLGSASATYGDESSDIQVSEPSFGDLNLKAKKLRALVPISNDLIRFSNPQANSIVRDDIVNTIGEREDLAFIRDDGTQNNPKGLRRLVLASHVITANTTINLQNIRNDLGKLKLKLTSANVKMIKPGWLISPRTEYFLSELVDGNGNRVFPEMDNGRIRAYPYAVSNTGIPENLGASGDESEIMLVDFSEVYIGEATGLIIDTSTEASYRDASNNLQSAYSKDQTLIRAIVEHDIGMRQPVAIAVLEGVTWGA